MTDRELVNEALDIQMRRHWSQARCCELAHMAKSTWADAVSRARTQSLTTEVRCKLRC